MPKLRIRAGWFDGTWILLVALAGGLLVYAGWSEYSPMDTPDIRAHQENAIRFLERGEIPYRGQGLSYSGWGPPGTSWLMIPGVLLGLDPRLAEVPGAFALHLGMLAFLFLIVRDWVGRGAALAAVSIAGFLPVVGPTLWPNGHPFFVLAVTYCLLRWIRDSAPRWFAAALVFAGAGLYVYFTIAPALIAVGAVALAYRRRVSFRSLAVAGVILLALWWPYLQFESSRGFADILSMVARRDLGGSSEAVEVASPVYCLASLPGETDFRGRIYLPWTGDADPQRIVYPRSGRLAELGYTICSLLNKSDRLFDFGYFLADTAAWPVALLVLAGWMGFWALCTGAWRESGIARRGLDRLRNAPGWLFLAIAVAGGALILLLMQSSVAVLLVGEQRLASEGRLVIEQFRMYASLGWIALIGGSYLGSRWENPPKGLGALVLMIGVSAALLTGLSEIERPWRFWWLWPLDAIAIAAFGERVLRSMRASRPVYAAGMAGLALLFFPYRYAAAQVETIRSAGYGGRESGQLQVLARLAEAGRGDPSAVYTVGVERLGDDADPTVSFGWVAFGLEYLEQVANIHAADISPADDFRIAEWRGDARSAAPGPCPWDGYSLMMETERFSLCRRAR